MKTLTTLFILLFSVSVMAQVQVAAGGLNFAETDNDYIVYDFPGMNKQELYNKALTYFSSHSTSPKDVISQTNNEMLTINAVAGGAVSRTNTHVFDLDYTLSVRVKDGRLRVDLPTVNNIVSTQFGKVQVINICSGKALNGDYFGIYNQLGKLKLERSKNDLEQFFNNEIAQLVDAVENTDDW